MARHGENIRKRTDGRWEGRYKFFDESRGKFVYRSVYGRSYEEAKEKLARARTALLLPKTPSAEALKGDCRRVLFSQAAGEWLAEISGRLKYATYIKYEAVCRAHLAETIGACRLCTDTAQALQEKISDHLSGRGMSESLQKSIVCVANQILAFANRKYASGVLLLERLPEKAQKKAVSIFSEAEQAKLLGYIYGRMDKGTAAVLLCLYAGLRLGELCALRWTDIDFAGMNLTVNRTVQRIVLSGSRTKTGLLETEPKSESSRRTIPLDPELLGLLSRHRGEQLYVFGGEKPLDPRTMQYRFQKILRDAGLGSRNFHTLRHTFATNCVENDMDVKALSELLGHSDVKITLNRYVHPTMDSKRRQLGLLADFYRRICGQTA